MEAFHSLFRMGWKTRRYATMSLTERSSLVSLCTSAQLIADRGLLMPSPTDSQLGINIKLYSSCISCHLLGAAIDTCLRSQSCVASGIAKCAIVKNFTKLNADISLPYRLL